MRLTGDGKVANQLIRVLRIDDVVDQVDVDVLPTNDGRGLFMLEALERSRELERLFGMFRLCLQSDCRLSECFGGRHCCNRDSKDYHNF